MHREVGVQLGVERGHKLLSLSRCNDVAVYRCKRPGVTIDADYGKLKKQVKEYDVIKRNIDSILRQPREPEQERETER